MMLQVGVVVTVIVFVHVLTHPSAVVTLTEYFPAAVMVMQLDVAPVLHKYVEPSDAGTQSELDSPRHNDPLPIKVQVADGFTLTIM